MDPGAKRLIDLKGLSPDPEGANREMDVGGSTRCWHARCTYRLSMFERTPAFLESTPEEQAGFVAHLVILSEDDDVLRPSLTPWLLRFTELAELTDDLDDDQRQAKVDAYYARWPIPTRLLALLEAEANEHAEAAERAAERASASIGTERAVAPVQRRAIPGTFGGGNLGLIAVRTQRVPTTMGSTR